MVVKPDLPYRHAAQLLEQRLKFCKVVLRCLLRVMRMGCLPAQTTPSCDCANFYR